MGEERYGVILINAGIIYQFRGDEARECAAFITPRTTRVPIWPRLSAGL